jgi:hypothetical protein
MNCEYFERCISMYKSESCNEEYPYCRIKKDIIRRVQRSKPVEPEVLNQIGLEGLTRWNEGKVV